MLSKEGLLEHQLLDLLVDGVSPFSALFRSLVLYCGYPRELAVSRVVDALISLEQKGWVKAWQLPGDGSHHEASERDLVRDLAAYQTWIPGVADLDDLSVDEVGLWYELTDAGREEWSRYYRREAQRQDWAWMLDDLRDERTVIVYASSDEAAEEALAYWLSVNPEIHLVATTRTAQTISGFKLRSGVFIPDGIRLTCQYRVADALPPV